MSDDEGLAAAATKTEFQNKLEEQAAAKGGLSYSYFAASANANATAAPPKPLTPEEAAALEQQAKARGNGSAWNAAGTYEERDVSAWARRRIEQLLILEGAGGEEAAAAAGAAARSPCGAVEVTSAAATGDAHVIFVRGKRRAAFELKVSMSFRSTSNPEIQGTAKTVEEVTGDDVDDEEDVPPLAVAWDAAIGGGVKDGGTGASVEAARCQKAAREGLRAALCQRLRQLRQEMRDGLA
jgi:hypothetical protein